MTRELLISKWLDNNLNPEEFKAFQQLEDYEDLVKLDRSIQRFKAPEYNAQQELEKTLHHIRTLKTKESSWLKPLMRIAAVLVIAFGLYYYISGLDTNYQTEIAQQIETLLPDESEIILNSASTLSFNKRNWSKNRLVNLEGEAFFKVAKGSKFKVVTSAGIVSVLGTEFNVKQRDNYFEVYCFEGLVGVETIGETQVLKPGESFRIIDGTIKKITNESAQLPTWLSKESSFDDVPVYLVFEEIERQYSITINSDQIEKTLLFNGTFTHTNLELALKSITIPLNLTYTIDNEQITILRD
ncbi:FecR family protein [Paucihalobacter sp.]|uniref:FecR family protein n=1 Tax=Paucihalobacter sp. TaxID=2850405 RepID=UPI002FE02F0A